MKRKAVIREQYLSRLEEGKDDTDVVKVVTGMRRCGKSTLMMQYMDRLRSEGVPDDHIVYANLESRQFEDITDHKGLNDWLAERMPKARNRTAAAGLDTKPKRSTRAKYSVEVMGTPPT